MRRITNAVVMLCIGVLLLSACGRPSAGVDMTSLLLVGDTLAPVDPQMITAPIEITGSSTVYPLSARIAEEFHAEGSRAQIDIKVTGTGGGLRSFCNGDAVDIVNASRPISEEEIQACRAVGREPVGFPVGMDALAVVVNPQNTFVDALTFEQLARIFSGQARTWDQIDSQFPAESIAVYSPGVDSGTFDYFVEVVLDGNESLIAGLEGVVLSEDDTELVRGIEGNPNAIGYFGYAYYQREEGRLRALSIDGGAGPVAPGAASVADGSYPLARPLFIYTSKQDLREHDSAAAFISYYIQHANDVIDGVGYFPTASNVSAEAQRTFVEALR